VACGTGALRRGKGYVFRAFKPVGGEVLTALYAHGRQRTMSTSSNE